LYTSEYFVEVIRPDSGYPALVSGIAGGAELIVIPEFEDDSARMADQLLGAYQRGPAHAIALVAERARYDADARSRNLQREVIEENIGSRVDPALWRNAVPLLESTGCRPSE
jgi:6-phosphofructokinase